MRILSLYILIHYQLSLYIYLLHIHLLIYFFNIRLFVFIYLFVCPTMTSVSLKKQRNSWMFSQGLASICTRITINWPSQEKKVQHSHKEWPLTHSRISDKHTDSSVYCLVSNSKQKHVGFRESWLSKRGLTPVRHIFLFHEQALYCRLPFCALIKCPVRRLWTVYRQHIWTCV